MANPRMNGRQKALRKDAVVPPVIPNQPLMIVSRNPIESVLNFQLPLLLLGAHEKDPFKHDRSRRPGAHGGHADVDEEIDKKTGLPVSLTEDEYDADGKLISHSKWWYGPNGISATATEITKYGPGGHTRSRTKTHQDQNGHTKGKTEEFGDDGKPVEETTWEDDGDFGLVSRTKKIFDHGRLIRIETTDASGATTTSDIQYDNSGNERRKTERDKNGKVTKVTITQIMQDGTKHVTVTDYSTDPATVHGVDYGPSGTPVRVW